MMARLPPSHQNIYYQHVLCPTALQPCTRMPGSNNKCCPDTVLCQKCVQSVINEVCVGYDSFLCHSQTNAGTGNPYEAVPNSGEIPPGTYWVGVSLRNVPARTIRFKLYSYANFDIIPGQNGQTSGAATNKPHANTASKWRLHLKLLGSTSSVLAIGRQVAPGARYVALCVEHSAVITHGQQVNIACVALVLTNGVTLAQLSKCVRDTLAALTVTMQPLP
jgi:hypothetical protein